VFKKIYSLCKKFLVSALLLYAYNSVNFLLDAVIPINFVTIFLVMLFGIPALFCLILFSFLI